MLLLKLIYSYLNKRKPRVKINDTHSSWTEILLGVSQGSIVCPLLFDISLCDFFMVIVKYNIA